MVANGGLPCTKTLTFSLNPVTQVSEWGNPLHHQSGPWHQFCLGKPTTSSKWPLTAILPLTPFEKWGIDFIGPISPAAQRSRGKYIIFATDYETKWVEGAATCKNDATTVAAFLFEHNITRFGCPLELVSDRGLHFLECYYWIDHWPLLH